MNLEYLTRGMEWLDPGLSVSRRKKWSVARARFRETIPIEPSIELAVDAWLEKSGHLFEFRDVFFSE